MLKLWRYLHPLLRPTLVLPLLMAAALLAFAASLGNVGDVATRVGGLPAWILWLSLGAAACYLACKAAQLALMLRYAGLRVPLRRFWLGFAVGELAVTLPLGLFSQNWVLAASRTVSMGRSSAATIMMIVAEVIATFLFLAIAGIPGWPYVQPLSITALAVMAALIALLVFERRARVSVERLRHPWLRRGAAVLLALLRALRRLSAPAILASSVAIAAVYLGALTAAFWLVGWGMGVPGVDYLTATTIYAFSLAAVLVGAGLFSQIGTVELLGMVAARAWGIDYADGFAMMLGFRIVWTASVWLLCLPVVAMTWRELRSPERGASADHAEKPID